MDFAVCFVAIAARAGIADAFAHAKYVARYLSVVAFVVDHYLAVL